ncbi:MAG: malto-oligosyltrehalose synthase [Planctomycetaceae bacterium]|nr:malto-oligosyltrehalose synthase [Planctomycetaceae bacterium]
MTTAPEQAVDEILAAVMRRMERERLPTATYRIQFHAGCTFREIAAVVPYLHALGISDLYASPFLQARPGSVHGYDIVNHAAINPEIGTLEDLHALRAALRDRGMGLIADVVPNHMAAVPQLNGWWQDVLENGPGSAFAGHFDIDWMPLKPDLANKVLLPVLGDQFGKVLEDGQLSVCYGEGSFWIAYFEQQFPLAPGTYSMILAPWLEELQERLGTEDADVLELFSILTAIRNLPPRTETDAERLAERRREAAIIKRRLHELVGRSEKIAEFVTGNLREMNGRVGDPRSFDRLDELLGDQAYRLAYWRVASDEINYRRFFDINELAAICTESPPVFAETHRLVFDWLDEGTVTGLRIDHPDGLYDPRMYLLQLQEAQFLRLCREESRARADGGSADPLPEEKLVEFWRASSLIPGSPLARPLYLVVEKILAPDEALPENWPVHGTVGYEFLNAVNGLFVDPAGQRPLTALYERFTGQPTDFAELAYQCKRLIVRMSMAGELNVLSNRLDRISERNRRTRDFTLSSLTRALQEVVACFSVYRTYVHPGHVLERDTHYIERAVARAKRRNPAMSGEIFDFLRDVLLLRDRDVADEREREAIQRFTGKFQQLTGPIMAKAVEDTAFYRFNRLVSLNEVGGEPAAFGTSVAGFHRFQQARLPRLSHSLNASSTHDTKRSEDVRARISVLSEIPREWRSKVQAWSRWHRRLKAEVDGGEVPSRNAEYLLYQTLIGVWPDAIPDGADRERLVARMQQYMLKVEREAKVHTSWISPHEAYETAVSRFVADLFATNRRRPFLADLHEFAGRIAAHGRWNSLSQLLLKLTAPGVPDFFQGMEAWNLTLVDPDNRQPVDFAARDQTLSELRTLLSSELPGTTPEDVIDSWLARETESVPTASQRLLETCADGRIKLFVTLLGLHARRHCGELFATGEYLPLETTGRFADCVVAFARRHGDQCAIIVAPRLTVKVAGFGGPPAIGDLWQDTAIRLPDTLDTRPFRELFTRRTWPSLTTDDVGSGCFPVAEALHSFPLGLWWTTQP